MLHVVDGVTCGANPSAVDATDRAGPTAGLFDRSNAKNPVKDWNFVYVPYCTGDVFGGTKPNGSVSGVTGTQKFVGYLNTQAFLQRMPLDFSVALAGMDGADLGRSLGNLTGGLPFTVVLSGDGVVRQRKMGRVLPADLQAWTGLK